MRKQRNDSGFSLVELVVVILIMGIIVVSLAPHAMKWVGRAKENTDVRAQDNLKSAAQIAIVEFQNEGKTLSSAQYLVTSSGIDVVGGTDPNSGMETYLESYLGGELPKVQSETGKVFQVEISSTGGVTVSVVTGTY